MVEEHGGESQETEQRRKSPGIRYTLQSHTPSDLLLQPGLTLDSPFTYELINRLTH
jgi:hypothetical protein